MVLNEASAGRCTSSGSTQISYKELGAINPIPGSLMKNALSVMTGGLINVKDLVHNLPG